MKSAHNTLYMLQYGNKPHIDVDQRPNVGAKIFWMLSYLEREHYIVCVQ